MLTLVCVFQAFRSVWVLWLKCALVRWAHALTASWTSGSKEHLATCRNGPVHIHTWLSLAFVKSWSERVTCGRWRWSHDRVCDTRETCVLLGMYADMSGEGWFHSWLACAGASVNTGQILKGTDFKKYYTGVSNCCCYKMTFGCLFGFWFFFFLPSQADMKQLVQSSWNLIRNWGKSHKRRNGPRALGICVGDILYLINQSAVCIFYY